jgi:hypothetical protein
MQLLVSLRYSVSLMHGHGLLKAAITVTIMCAKYHHYRYIYYVCQVPPLKGLPSPDP